MRIERIARRPRGFSLIEVLVAFVILALVATALFGLFSTSMGNVSAAEEWSRALAVAQSRLDAAAATQPLKDATDAGATEDGRVQWTSTVAQYVPPAADPELDQSSLTLAFRMYRVNVEVKYTGGDGRARTLTLSTVRLGPKPLT